MHIYLSLSLGQCHSVAPATPQLQNLNDFLLRDLELCFGRASCVHDLDRVPTRYLAACELRSLGLGSLDQTVGSLFLVVRPGAPSSVLCSLLLAFNLFASWCLIRDGKLAFLLGLCPFPTYFLPLEWDDSFDRPFCFPRPRWQEPPHQNLWRCPGTHRRVRRTDVDVPWWATCRGVYLCFTLFSTTHQALAHVAARGNADGHLLIKALSFSCSAPSRH